MPLNINNKQNLIGELEKNIEYIISPVGKKKKVIFNINKWRNFIKDVNSFLETVEEIPISNHYVSEEEFLKMTNEDTHWELRYGEIIRHSPVRMFHSRLSVFLISLLREFVIMKDLGEFHHAPAVVKLAKGLIYEPDLFFVTKEQMKGLDNNQVYFEGVPKLIIEIVSPNRRKYDIHTKFIDYEHFGVQEYWILDHDNDEYKFYQLVNNRFEQMKVENNKINSLVLLGLQVDLRWFEKVKNNEMVKISDILSRV